MVTIFNWFLGTPKSLKGVTFSCYKYSINNKVKYGVCIDDSNDHSETFSFPSLSPAFYEPMDYSTSQIPQLSICVDEAVCSVKKSIYISILS